MNRLIRALKKYGFREVAVKLPGFIGSRIKRFILYPGVLTRFGITRSRWQKFQIEHELDFWNNIEKSRFYESGNDHKDLLIKSFNTHKNKFTDLKLDFLDGTVADVGCGPQGGILSFVKAKYKLGVDPLAEEYSKKYALSSGIVIVSSMGENIPLLSNMIDACFCINALDHTMRPYLVLKEIYRILKPGGYFAFSVDVNGTKGHPIKIYEKDLDAFLMKGRFKILEKKCSTEKSVWGEYANVPLYVFQGFKKEIINE